MKRWWRRLVGAPAKTRDRADLLEAARHHLAEGQVEEAMRLASEAASAAGSAAGWAAACRIAHDAGRPDDAASWADASEAATGSPAPGERHLFDEVRLRSQVLARLRRPPAPSPAFEPQARRVLNLLAFSLPYTSNGYATRSHGLLSAMREAGWDVLPVTRPGYPVDVDGSLRAGDLSAQDHVGSLTYHRLLSSTRRTLGHSRYLLAAADEIGQAIRELRPTLVHAASNYMTAFPAAIAAREAGLPFVYEVRGFWDVTRASSDPSFATSPECRQLRHFESELLARADALVTLTDAMRQELLRRGAPTGRVHVARNAVSESIAPRPRCAVLAERLGIEAGVPVIGYIGSFVDYEGLDDLVDACALLRTTGRRFHLLLVGDGLVRESVLARIAAAGLGDVATALGSVPHAEVADYYSLVDLCPFPRKPWPVCELVSPLKPYEAMAMGKCVLVSSVAAMAEMVPDLETGVVFSKGDVSALASALATRLDAGDAKSMGARARQWVLQERTWKRSAESVAQAYTQASEGTRICASGLR